MVRVFVKVLTKLASFRDTLLLFSKIFLKTFIICYINGLWIFKNKNRKNEKILSQNEKILSQNEKMLSQNEKKLSLAILIRILYIFLELNKIKI